MKLLHHSAWLSACALLASSALTSAAVVRLEVTKRADLDATAYEEIVGRLHFAIDPAKPGNDIIADVKLAPVNAQKHVCFSADLRILKPKDPAQSNGAAWVEIPNRGGKASLPAAMMAQGFTLLNVGWEFDVPKQQGKMRIEVPAAQNKDGSSIRGVVSATFTPDKQVEEHLLTDLEPYPPVDVAGPDSRLVLRHCTAYPGGTELPRGTWSLENGRIRLKNGFKPGTTYEVFYLAEAPPVAGLGYAAIRDAVAWLKHGEDSPAKVRHAYAFGSSQCGRFLRDFIYLGFNTDERDRQALDGVIAHIAGAGRLVLNQRWATPRSQAAFHTASYPFADTAQTDPISGHAEGILENPRMRHAPKIFYINTSTEYWGGGRVAALTHTDPSGTKDIDFPADVRSYYYAGTQHGPASFPPAAHVEGGPLGNPVNAGPVTMALRLAMHRWVSEGLKPPPSVHPKLSDGTLVPVKEVRFPKVPGMGDPKTISAGPRLPNPLWSDGAGAGIKLPLLVPQVDADGNDIAGIHMPDVAVPLGTATGWVFRAKNQGETHELVALRGAWAPLAATKAQREATGDPRLSMDERYASKQSYLLEVKKVLQKLIQQRLLLPEDLAPQMKQSSERWDWVMRPLTE